MTRDVQRVKRIEHFFHEHQAALVRQGAVVGGWRMRGERRAGPYFRLECRLPSGPKVSVYLGLEGPLVAATRDRLEELRLPLRKRRQLEKALRYVRRGARAARKNLAQELTKVGLHLKGTEIRGFAQRKRAEVLAANLPDPATATTEKLEDPLAGGLANNRKKE